MFNWFRNRKLAKQKSEEILGLCHWIKMHNFSYPSQDTYDKAIAEVEARYNRLHR